MMSKKNIVLVAVLAGIGIFLLVGSIFLDQPKPALPPKGDGTKWMWVCKARETYQWNIQGTSSDGTVVAGTSTWTITKTENSSISGGYGNLTGTITSTGGFEQDTSALLYILNFTGTGNYSLEGCNYLRNGGYLPWYNISSTAAGLYNIWIGQSVQNYTPVIYNQLEILNNSLQTWISTQTGWSGNVQNGTIDFLRGRWVVCYKQISNDKIMMEWTIAQTGLVTQFRETDANGNNLVLVTFQYPGLHWSVILSFVVGALTIVASMLYVFIGKWKDKREVMQK